MPCRLPGPVADAADAPGSPPRAGLALWPEDERPDPTTLFRWLRRAVAAGLLRQDGAGQHPRPLRYWLAANEERWRQDPMAVIRMPELFYPPPAEGPR